jgi:phage terminase large subunit-like protein
MVEVRQGPPSLSEPMLKLQALISAEKFVHNGHPILRWNAMNVVSRRNVNGDIAPDRTNSQEKIDGLVAVIIAMNRKVSGAKIEAPPESIYETRNPLSIPLQGF